MKKVLVALIALFGIVACKTPCSQPGSAAAMVSNAVAAKWQCSAPDKVLADVSQACAKLGLCTVPPTLPASRSGQVGGPIANTACPLIVGELQSLAASQVPPAWGCNPSAVGSTFAAGLLALCEAIPF